MSINSRNAAATIARVEDEMRKAREESNQSRQEPAEVLVVDNVDGEVPESVALEQANTEPEQTQATEQTEVSDPLDELTKLKREHEILDKNFRNIQRVMTPVWEENAKLRKEIEQLRASMAEYSERDDSGKTAHFSTRLEALKDAVPEGAEIVEELHKELQSLRQAVRDRDAVRPADPDESNRAAMAQIIKLHPDMTPDVLDDHHPFWKFVDAQGPLSGIYKQILASPGTHSDGVEVVSGLMSAFKTGHNNVIAKPTAPVVKKPADVAPVARPSQSPLNPNVTRQPEGLLTQAQLDAMMKESSRTTPARAQQIAEQIKQHMKASAQLRH